MKRIEGQYLARIMGTLISMGDLQTFSVTKIATDYPYNDLFTDMYLKNIGTCLGKEGIKFSSVMFLNNFIAGTVPDSQPRIVIIGSREYSDVRKETNKLLRIIEQCPEGPVLEAIQEEYKKRGIDWTQSNFPKFLKKLKEENVKGIVVEYGPEYYTKGELEDIQNLFMPPVYSE
jgi:hypothetical protein